MNSQFLAGQQACLLHPIEELRLVELIVLADVEVAHLLLLRFAGGTGLSDVPRKKVTFTYFAKQ